MVRWKPQKWHLQQVLFCSADRLYLTTDVLFYFFGSLLWEILSWKITTQFMTGTELPVCLYAVFQPACLYFNNLSGGCLQTAFSGSLSLKVSWKSVTLLNTFSLSLNHWLSLFLKVWVECTAAGFILKNDCFDRYYSFDVCLMVVTDRITNKCTFLYFQKKFLSCSLCTQG